MKKTYTKILAAAPLVALLALVVSGRTVADRDGAAFAEALDYTVKIRVAVQTAFIEDTQGSHNGAGFLVDRERGWIVTNAHVSSQSVARIELTFQEYDYMPAGQLYVDPYLDLAVLAVSPEQIPDAAKEARLDCDGYPGMGKAVGAFGHPWGHDFTGNRGIVSGVSVSDGLDWIQTDTPLNAGNSGGPLIDLATRKVVGVNTQVMAGSNVQNLNFAVPVKHVCRILALLEQEIEPTPAELPAILALDDSTERKVRVVRPLADGALAPGDEILAIGDNPPIKYATDLIDQVRGKSGTIDVKVRRDGQDIVVQVPLRPSIPIIERVGIRTAGVLFSYHEVEGRNEILVHDVEDGSYGSMEGLQAYDMLVSVNDQPVATLEALEALLQERAGETVKIMVRRPLEWTTGYYTYFELAVDEPERIGISLGSAD